VGDILQTLEKIEPLIKEPNTKATEVLKNPTLVANPKASEKPKVRPTASAKEVCLQEVWPSDKPQQKIVFPRTLEASQGDFASLWVMLDATDITNRLASMRYNQFLFLPTPHPMILWITLLYHREHGPRWLPCYLDLKTESGQIIARTLSQTSKYWILFFALEGNGKCENLLTVSIPANQCQLLTDWANQSEKALMGKPQISKRMLKRELEKLKPKIISKLEATPEASPN
jgi:serine/threonine-protein kinase